MFIGVFWIYDNQIFCETQNINDIKPINGFIDSDLAHYQVWNKVKNQHPKFYLFEYEDIPRGRIVYDIENEQFIIYCNKDILKQKISKKLILEKFQLLNKKAIFIEDEHYKIC
jgi:hypothetical protein